MRSLQLLLFSSIVIFVAYLINSVESSDYLLVKLQPTASKPTGKAVFKRRTEAKNAFKARRKSRIQKLVWKAEKKFKFGSGETVLKTSKSGKIITYEVKIH